jgi:hypothetical protein
LVERRWRCVQHFLFSCKASPLECPDSSDLWLDLLDLLSDDAVSAVHLRQALYVDSFDLAAVRCFCMPCLLDPFCFLSACPRSVSVAVSSILACYVLLVGASAADAAMPAGARVFAAGLVHGCLRLLSLPASSRVARRCPPSFRPFGGAAAEAPLGKGVVPDLSFFMCTYNIPYSIRYTDVYSFSWCIQAYRLTRRHQLCSCGYWALSGMVSRTLCSF